MVHGDPARRLVTEGRHLDSNGLDSERTTLLRVDLEVDLGLTLLVDLERESLRLDLVIVELVGLGEDLFRRVWVVGVHFPTCGSTRLDLGQESIRLRSLRLVHEVILRVVLPLGFREEQRGAL